ncbi:hypothetical protein KAI54_03670 [Candidatus Gracilibacteria bacterium]|nr:hypothetical protein [Candidatus Gracilibacteria bacterium]
MSPRFLRDRVIAYKKGDIYLAVSLEFDLLAEGKTIKEALDRLHDAVLGYLKICCSDNELDEEIYRKAPKKYQNLYDLFIEIDAKKRKKDAEKKKEDQLRRREIYTSQSTYPTTLLCHA